MKGGTDHIFILFGATGDLAREKILPALFSIYLKQATLPRFNLGKSNFSIIAVSRRAYSDEDYRDFIRKEAKIKKPHKKEFEKFLEQVTYISGTFDTKTLYTKISEHIQNSSHIVTYLAIAPHFFRNVIERGAKAHLWKQGKNHRILIEKPYAEDVSGITKLEKLVSKYIPKQALFVDHYLGKQPLIDIQILRRQHKVLESYLQKKISRIVVRLFEQNDVARRGEFYDKTGAFVDVGANHMLQMLAAVAAPLSREGLNTQKLFASLYPDKTCLIPLQYAGYANTRGVDKETRTETAFEILLHSTLPHLKNAQIVLAGGKAFDSFRSDTTVLYTDGAELRIELKPKERITAKELALKKTFKNTQDAYETIITDAFAKKPRYFVGLAEIHEEWRIIKEVQRCAHDKNPKTYQKGTQVPEYDTTNPIWDMS